MAFSASPSFELPVDAQMDATIQLGAAALASPLLVNGDRLSPSS